ncbi:serine/threonine-protein kinase [Actinomadura rubrisoli]|uniref:non-specific serine/threonine protein kinase n=1 Tax=Actinomadura rubrisoli TaxID=2530368 RepID=A0A4R5APB4_9ACTN|nr:serine/threonine-protein kinase [Actinomadura rubrisoli]TDD73630.1 serine/threonine protein kinase [Actinomadura rubrisoli]
MAFNVVDGWTVPGFTHERELSGGATGRVVLAVDDMTSTKVAIKYLDGRLGADEAFLARFRAAARNLSQLEDPNVVDFYDFVETPDGAAIVMERVDGVGLRRVLAAQGPTGPLAALSMLGGVLLGLAAAHAQDVVHGAVRPANVLVDRDGNARLADFATVPAGTEAQSGPAYAAPELWDGAPASVAGDLYAATAVFFECLTGRPPFAGRNMAKQHREAPIPAEEVPGPLRGLIARGLAKDPEERPKSAADFLAAVEDAAVSAYGPSWEAQGRGRLTELAGQAAAQPEPPRPARPARSSGRNPVVAAVPSARGSRGRWIAVGAAALVAAGAVTGGVLLMSKDDAEGPPDPNPALSTAPPQAAPQGGVDPAALITHIDQATGRAPGAAFTFRRTGCCGAPASGRGTFGLTPSGPASYSMTISGAGATRKAARTVLVQDTVYTPAGKRWRRAPTTGRGYPALAEQVRLGSSVANLTTLLRSATTLRKSGAVYQGEAPVDRLSQADGVGPMYAEMARTTGARQINFAIRLDRGNRPVKLWLRAQGPSKGRAQVLQASYSGWGRKPPIKAPR